MARKLRIEYSGAFYPPRSPRLPPSHCFRLRLATARQDGATEVMNSDRDRERARAITGNPFFRMWLEVKVVEKEDRPSHEPMMVGEKKKTALILAFSPRRRNHCFRVWSI